MNNLCPTLSKADIVSFDDRNGTRVTVGATVKDGRDFFVTLCCRDIAGCQHIVTRAGTVLALQSRISRVLQLTLDARLERDLLTGPVNL
jgi:hypothetical protein